MGAVDTITSRLRGENVPFEVHHHPLAYTAQHVAQSEHVPGRMVAKVVVVFADGRLALVVVPAPAHVSLEKAASAIKAREVRLASEEEMLVAEIDSTLHVQRTPGKKSTLALVVPTAINWAEGGADAVGEDGAVVVEDYHMEIYRQTRETVTTELVKRRRRS